MTWDDSMHDGSLPGPRPDGLPDDDRRYVHRNAGLAGGTLDARRHLEAAVPRLLNQQERAVWRDAQRARVEVLAQTFPGRDAADRN